MRKVGLVILTVLGIFGLCSSYAYAKKCAKCKEDLEKNKTRYYTAGIAHRDFESPIIHKDGKSYAVYKCPYGHVYLVDLDEEKNK